MRRLVEVSLAALALLCLGVGLVVLGSLAAIWLAWWWFAPRWVG